MNSIQWIHEWWRVGLEISLLAVGIYYVLMFVRGTRGWSVAIGFLLLMALTLATWFYSYCQIGAVAMIFATSAIVWRTSVLPKWTAVGAVLGFLPLVHTWMPLPAAVSSLAWILLIGLVMLIVPIGAQETSQPVNDDAPGVRN